MFAPRDNRLALLPFRTPHCVREPYRQNPLLYRKAHYHLKGLHSLSPSFFFSTPAWDKSRTDQKSAEGEPRCDQDARVAVDPLCTFFFFLPHPSSILVLIKAIMNIISHLASVTRAPIHFVPYLISCLTLKVPSVSSRLLSHTLHFWKCELYKSSDDAARALSEVDLFPTEP